jgi:hypothetical protein
LGVKRFVANGMMALHCALKLLRLKGEVITRPFALQQGEWYTAEQFSVGFCGSLNNRFVFIFLLLCAAVSFGDIFVLLISRGCCATVVPI